MLPPIPTQKIVATDQGSPLRIPDDNPEEPLPNHIPEFSIDENMKLIMFALKNDKGKSL